MPVDDRVIRILQTSLAFRLTFDSDYIQNLSLFHGARPLNPYVVDSTGVVRRIGWFVALIDEQSRLPSPFQPATYYDDCDTRVDDRSIPALLNDEVCPFHFGERIVPFAAVYTDNQPPTSLRLYTLDWLPADSLCFDRSTSPPSIVYCNAEIAVEQALKWDDDRTQEFEFDYTFLVPVANSFRDFASQLCHSPPQRDA